MFMMGSVDFMPALPSFLVENQRTIRFTFTNPNTTTGIETITAEPLTKIYIITASIWVLT